MTVHLQPLTEVKGIKGTVSLQDCKGHPVSHQLKWGCLKSVTLYYADIRLQQPGNVGFQRASLDLVGWLRGSQCSEFDFPKSLHVPFGETKHTHTWLIHAVPFSPPSFVTLCVEVKWMVGCNPGFKQTLLSVDPKRDIYFCELENTQKKPFSVLTSIKTEILINPIPYSKHLKSFNCVSEQIITEVKTKISLEILKRRFWVILFCHLPAGWRRVESIWWILHELL